MAYDKYTIIASDLYNPRLPLDQNKISFNSDDFVDIQKDHISNINFYFNDENNDSELDEPRLAMLFAFKLAEANPRPKLLMKFLLASVITPSIFFNILR